MNIKLKEEEEEEEKIMTNSHTQCELCKKHKANYSCPRCNKAYCSLDCYRDPSKHLECSESFYQEQVIQELQMDELKDENKKKMVDILKKCAEQLESDDIIPNVDDNEEIFKENEEELDARKLIAAYEKELKNWLPWWHQIKPQPLLEENEEK
jgi:hypothetical protein